MNTKYQTNIAYLYLDGSQVNDLYVILLRNLEGLIPQ
jgi:hypothetical protein